MKRQSKILFALTLVLLLLQSGHSQNCDVGPYPGYSNWVVVWGGSSDNNNCSYSGSYWDYSYCNCEVNNTSLYTSFYDSVCFTYLTDDFCYNKLGNIGHDNAITGMGSTYKDDPNDYILYSDRMYVGASFDWPNLGYFYCQDSGSHQCTQDTRRLRRLNAINDDELFEDMYKRQEDNILHTNLLMRNHLRTVEKLTKEKDSKEAKESTAVMNYISARLTFMEEEVRLLKQFLDHSDGRINEMKRLRRLRFLSSDTTPIKAKDVVQHIPEVNFDNNKTSDVKDALKIYIEFRHQSRTKKEEEKKKEIVPVPTTIENTPTVEVKVLAAGSV